jgi:alginate O-acetyltransferase complex protein AlgF
MIRILRATALMAVLMSVFALGAVARAAGPDEGLYAPVPPDGSAFVRFVQADPAVKEDAKPKAAGKAYDGREFASVSAYYVVPQGKTALEFGPAKDDRDLVAGKFYTVVLLAGGQMGVIEDKAADNRAKALIQLYNLSAKPDLSLKTADGKVEVVPATPAGASGSREINAVKVPLALHGTGASGSEPVGDVTLERGKALGLFAFDNGVGGVRIVQVSASTDTTK